MSYESDRAELQAAYDTIERLYAPTLKAAEAQGDVYVLHFNRYGMRHAEPFLTLHDALVEAEGDMQPLFIVAPDGRQLDPRNNGKPINGDGEQ